MKKSIGMIAMAALLSLPAMAQSRATNTSEAPAKEHRMKAHKGDRIAELPNVTEEQKVKLKAIHEATRKANEPKREEMKAIREKMKAVRMSENPDQAELNRLIDKSHGVKADMEKTRVAGEMKAMTILTPEQQATYKAKMKERGHKMEKRQHMEHRQKMERGQEQRKTIDK